MNSLNSTIIPFPSYSLFEYLYFKDTDPFLICTFSAHLEQFFASCGTTLLILKAREATTNAVLNKAACPPQNCIFWNISTVNPVQLLGACLPYIYCVCVWTNPPRASLIRTSASPVSLQHKVRHMRYPGIVDEADPGCTRDILHVLSFDTQGWAGHAGIFP